MTLSRSKSGSFLGGGSVGNTSMPAPAIHFSLSALTRASCWTMGPRAVLMKYAAGFISRKWCSLTSPRVLSFRKVFTVTKSLSRNTVSMSTSSTPRSFASRCETNGSHARRRLKPSGLAMRKSSRAMLPHPTEPSTLPRISPVSSPSESRHLPARVMRSSRNIFLESANASARMASATGARTPLGVIESNTPASVSAAASIRS